MLVLPCAFPARQHCVFWVLHRCPEWQVLFQLGQAGQSFASFPLYVDIFTIISTCRVGKKWIIGRDRIALRVKTWYESVCSLEDPALQQGIPMGPKDHLPALVGVLTPDLNPWSVSFPCCIWLNHVAIWIHSITNLSVQISCCSNNIHPGPWETEEQCDAVRTSVISWI